MDKCGFTFSPELTDEEIMNINNNMNDIVSEYSKRCIQDKEQAIAQYIMTKQQEEIEKLKKEIEFKDQESLQWANSRKSQLIKENQELKQEIHNLNERLENFIPRRRVRRVFKQLKKILEQDGITGDLDIED